MVLHPLCKLCGILLAQLCEVGIAADLRQLVVLGLAMPGEVEGLPLQVQIHQELGDARGQEATNVVHRHLVAVSARDPDPAHGLLGNRLVRLLIMRDPHFKIVQNPSLLFLGGFGLALRDALGEEVTEHSGVVVARDLDEDDLRARGLELFHHPFPPLHRTIRAIVHRQRAELELAGDVGTAGVARGPPGGVAGEPLRLQLPPLRLRLDGLFHPLAHVRQGFLVGSHAVRLGLLGEGMDVLPGQVP
mmetsp:Transcript_119031/g.333441  ORF Transcript_119031/g.333441 Transcript_119031/m.333441 type:complete len:246 (-) Transcript_119031:285-1022(-)